MGDDGICTPVSDQCSEWDDENGVCTCCYVGYKLVKGDCKLEWEIMWLFVKSLF